MRCILCSSMYANLAGGTLLNSVFKKFAQFIINSDLRSFLQDCFVVGDLWEV